VKTSTTFDESPDFWTGIASESVTQEICFAQHFPIDDCCKLYRTLTRTF